MKNVLFSLFFLFSSGIVFSDHFHDEDFMGDWTATLPVKGGVTVTHTPEEVILGNLHGQNGLFINVPFFNDIELKGPIRLPTDATFEEFVKALISCGLLDE